mmetsp:Transcript_30103/g.96852  ORF Transcript_30103/g.96852 Transcript_30103/m.96852 type:complete len:172 (-) Transcript_30103:833-1348(-)
MPLMCSMSVQTASRNMRSCETTTTILLFHTIEVARVRCSHSTPSIERWFVGSSSSRISGFANRAAARATRTLHPPDSAFIGLDRSSSENPKLTSIALARPSDPSASIAISRSTTSASFKADSWDVPPSDMASRSSVFCRSSSSSRSMSALSTMSTGWMPSLIAARGISCAT